MDPSRECHLVAQAQAGNERAFETLYQEYRFSIFSYVRKIVHNTQSAHEVTNDVFSGAFCGIQNFEKRSSFLTWLTRIAHNMSLIYLRQQERRLQRNVSLPHDDLMPPTAVFISKIGMPEEELVRREMYEQLRDGINSLPAPQRAVIIAGPLQRRTGRQLVQLLNLRHIDALKGRLHRARENLKLVLANKPAFAQYCTKD